MTYWPIEWLEVEVADWQTHSPRSTSVLSFACTCSLHSYLIVYLKSINSHQKSYKDTTINQKKRILGREVIKRLQKKKLGVVKNIFWLKRGCSLKKNLREWEKEKEGSEKRFGVGKKKLAEFWRERERAKERVHLEILTKRGGWMG